MFFKDRSFQKVFFLFFILFALTAFCTGATAAESNEMGSGEFVFHPVGFFQFGPMVDLGPRIGTSTFLDAHIRWSYAGLLYQAIETDGFSSSKVDPNSFGVGAKLIHFFKNPSSPHGMYIGGLFEYTWGGDSGTEDEGHTYERDWSRKWKGYTVMFNMGYRWRFPSGFFMQLGGFAGFHNQYKAETTREKNSYYSTEKKESDPEGVRVIAMIEFSIGTEFGK
jgi:hypothetical protein